LRDSSVAAAFSTGPGSGAGLSASALPASPSGHQGVQRFVGKGSHLGQGGGAELDAKITHRDVRPQLAGDRLNLLCPEPITRGRGIPCVPEFTTTTRVAVIVSRSNSTVTLSK
jgi:hypothetical protein